MTMTHQVPDSVEQIRPVQMMAVGNQAQIPVPFIRVTACGLLTIETVTEIVSTDPPLARYVSLSPEQLRGRGTAPALLLLKLLLSRPERFALRDWLMEQFCRDRELFSSVRIDNIVSQLRSLLCPPAYEPLRTHLVAHSRSSSSSGDGYQLASYPLIWTDLDALTWNVEQAARMERFGDDPLPYWERAYALAKRGIFLPDEMYSDWAAARCGEVAGVLRQSVQALARLYLARHGETGEEEALLLLRSYWQEHPQEEDVLRPLMELLGQRECYQEALEYYAKLETILSEEGEEPDARTQDLAEYIRTKQIQRRNPAPSRPLHELATRTRIVEANKMAVEESAPSLLPSSTRTQRGSNFGSHFMLTDEGGEALSSGRIFAQKEMLVGSEKG
jgi:DNA-binding SARP family transcriptional activator